MKTAIMGKRYDTESATFIGKASQANKPSTSWSAALYRKPITGEYFLAGEGGLMTRWGDNSGIFLLDAHEARKWAEEYLEDLTDDELLAAFA